MGMIFQTRSSERRGRYGREKTYNTPHRRCVVQTQLTEAECQEFENTCRTYSLNRSGYLWQAVLYGPDRQRT